MTDPETNPVSSNPNAKEDRPARRGAKGKSGARYGRKPQEHASDVTAENARRQTVDPRALQESSHGVPQSPEDQPTQEVRAAQEQIEGELDPEKAELGRGVLGVLPEAEQREQANVGAIVQNFKALGLGETAAINALALREDLDQATKDAVMEQMRGEEMDPSQRETREQSERRGERMEGPIGHAEQIVAEAKAAAASETDPVKQKEKEKHHGALAHKMEHLEKWMRVPPKEWGLRFGKTLAGLIALIVIGIILQMAMINKAAGKTK